MTPSPSPAEVNLRLQGLEKTMGESLLSLQQSSIRQNDSITQLQAEMHKLVELNERQIVLQQQSQESSRAIERAFSTIQSTRTDLALALDKMDGRWAEWRTRHELENADTARFASSARGGLRVLGLLGVVLWGVLGTIAWDWRGRLEEKATEDRAASKERDSMQDVRLQALTEQIQEIRLSRERERLSNQEPHP